MECASSFCCTIILHYINSLCYVVPTAKMCFNEPLLLVKCFVKNQPVGMNDKSHTDCVVFTFIASLPLGNDLSRKYPRLLFRNLSDNAVMTTNLEWLNYKVGSASLKYI